MADSQDVWGIDIGQAGLKAVQLRYAEAADQARQEDLPYEGYLLEVARRESETRRQHRIQRYLRQSKLPLEKIGRASCRERV